MAMSRFPTLQPSAHKGGLEKSCLLTPSCQLQMLIFSFGTSRCCHSTPAAPHCPAAGIVSRGRPPGCTAHPRPARRSPGPARRGRPPRRPRRCAAGHRRPTWGLRWPTLPSLKLNQFNRKGLTSCLQKQQTCDFFPSSRDGHFGVEMALFAQFKHCWEVFLAGNS